MQFRLIGFFIIVGIISFSIAQDSFAEESYKVSIPKGASVLGCEVNSLCYIPDPIFVNVDDVVEWTNKDSTAHTVSSGTPKDGEDGIIYSDLIQPEEVFAFSFDEPGSFPYFCTIHPWMEGMIVVSPPLLKPVESHEITEMRISESGSIIVTIKTDAPKAREALPMELVFTDENHILLSHINYDFRMVQDGEDVLLIENAHSIDGTVELPSTILESDNPVDVSIGLRGIYLDSESARSVYETMEILISDETPVILGVSPKAQMQRGVNSQDVICRQGFELMMKTSDKSPACVTLESTEKLIARGWGSLI